MGHHLPDEVVHGIRIRIEAGEAVPAIAEAVMVGKKRLQGGNTCGADALPASMLAE